MQIEQIIGLLIEERERVNRAIQALQGSRVTASPAPARKKRRGMSAEARKAQGERMRAFWASRRAQKAR